jgi:signal transduction histidine kinase
MMRFVRDLAMGLRPACSTTLGLQPALAWQAREFSRRYNVPVDLHVDGDLEDLPDPHRTCIYRVVQEALTNCAKHSNATAIDIVVRRSGDRLDATVHDNGVGDCARLGVRGLGLTGIKERVKEMQGTVTIARDPPAGPCCKPVCLFRRLTRQRRLALRIVLGDDHGIVRRGCGRCSRQSPTWKCW